MDSWARVGLTRGVLFIAKSKCCIILQHFQGSPKCVSCGWPTLRRETSSSPSVCVRACVLVCVCACVRARIFMSGAHNMKTKTERDIDTPIFFMTKHPAPCTCVTECTNLYYCFLVLSMLSASFYSCRYSGMCVWSCCAHTDVLVCVCVCVWLCCARTHVMVCVCVCVRVCVCVCATFHAKGHKA